MPISRAEWDALVVALKSVEQLEQACAAAEKLHQEAAKEDVPALLTLLGDDDAFVREAAAWPLSELGGSPFAEGPPGGVSERPGRRSR
jgi:HEAT repeat protein